MFCSFRKVLDARHIRTSLTKNRLFSGNSRTRFLFLFEWNVENFARETLHGLVFASTKMLVSFCNFIKKFKKKFNFLSSSEEKIYALVGVDAKLIFIILTFKFCVLCSCAYLTCLTTRGAKRADFWPWRILFAKKQFRFEVEFECGD